MGLRRFIHEMLGCYVGTAKRKAPPEKFGETLEAEQLRAGSFLDEADVDPDQWDRMMVRLLRGRLTLELLALVNHFRR